MNVGDEINVKVKEIRPRAYPCIPGPETAGRRSVGCYQANAIRKVPTDRSRDQPDRLTAASVEIEEGVEGPGSRFRNGLDQQNIHPSKVVNVTRSGSGWFDIDEERRRISLGVEEKFTPWQQFAETYATSGRPR